MRARLLAIRNMVNVISTRKYAAKPIRCDAHMNELPIPCGPWEIYYKDKQAWYTQCLFAGAVWWLFSLIMMIWTESLFLNWGPPMQPGPPSDMVEECDDS